MAKRFMDTELWDKDKFIKCSQKIKLLTLFIFSKCDCVGVFKMSNSLTSLCVGEAITDDDILAIPADIEKLESGAFWLTKFCKYQYGELKETCKPHKKYIEMLKTLGLYQRVSIEYTKGINTLQETDKDKEEETEKELKKIPHELESRAFEFFGSVPLGNLRDWLDCHDPPEIFEAMRLAEQSGVKTVNYVNGILVNGVKNKNGKRTRKDFSEHRESDENKYAHLDKEFL